MGESVSSLVFTVPPAAFSSYASVKNVTLKGVAAPEKDNCDNLGYYKDYPDQKGILLQTDVDSARLTLIPNCRPQNRVTALTDKGSTERVVARSDAAGI